ncbi:hypothetical protein FOBRF1_007236 [Fusarium oxysporum]
MGSFHDRIYAWLESVTQQPFNNANEHIPDESQRSDIKPAQFMSKSAGKEVLLSPPVSLKRPPETTHPSEMSQEQTPKRRRTDDNRAADNTPRANALSFDLNSDASSLRSGTSSAVSRQSSPTKQLNRLRLHPKGSDSKPMVIDDEDMPLSLANFVLEMERVMKSKFVPGHLEPIISEQKRHIRSLLAFDSDVYTPVSEAQDNSPMETCTFDDVRRIVAKTKDAAEHNQDEAGWNNQVHTPILEAVVCGHYDWGKQLAGFTTCITAGILPEYRVENIPGKKVDYTLFIEPKYDAESLAAIDALWRLRGTVNHTDFSPLQKRPVTVSIETKRANESLGKATLQMSVWHAAQWRLLEELAGPAALDKLGFLPGVFVQGDKWEFVASSYSNGRTILWTQRTIGSTQSELGVFQIMAGLNKLRKWSLEEFWPWYKTYVLKVGVEVEQTADEEVV